MRIGIDCRTILNPDKERFTGIEHYTYQLVRHLLKIDKKNQYVLFFDRSIKEKRIDKFKKKNTIIRYFPFSQYSKFLPVIYSHFLVNAFIAREKLDVFHSPTPYLPKSYRGPAVVTVHDLFNFKFPQWSSSEEWRYNKKVVSSALKNSSKIISVSQSTKRDIINLFKIKPSKIRVVYNGVDARFFQKAGDKEVKRVKRKLGISGDYILYLGAFSKRKNIVNIINSFEEIKEEKEGRKYKFKNLKLVLAGKQTGDNKKKILRMVKHSKFKKDIILTGYVEPDDINPLYEGAKIFLFPSFYEGFGLPLLEAAAKGLPIITSSTSSLPEIADGAALLVDPNKKKEISFAIFTLLTDKKLVRELSRKAKARAKKFSWLETARKTLKVYKEVKRKSNVL